MSGFVLLHPWAVGLLLVLPGIHWLFRRGERRRVAAVRSFAPARKGSSQAAPGPYLTLTALLLIVVAVAQPVWQAREASKSGAGLDVVFLLDVSRSMLTRDGGASRIEQARTAIIDAMGYAADERFALVVFSGNASVECPLTNDYAFLAGALKAASRDSVTLGGSRPGDAIRFAAGTAFDDASRNTRRLVLLTDGGDDAHSTDGASAAAELAKRGIGLVAAGVGDTAVPGFVPTSEADPTPVLYGGKPVTTRLDTAGLQRICKASAKCIYTTLPDPAFHKAVLDKPRAGGADVNTASITGSLSAIAAAFLLAAECLVRGRRTS